jgi:hypothetical protein
MTVGVLRSEPSRAGRRGASFHGERRGGGGGGGVYYYGGPYKSSGAPDPEVGPPSWK